MIEATASTPDPAGNQSAYFGAYPCLPLLSDEFYRMTLEVLILGLSSRFTMEPAVGVEPTTCGLQNRLTLCIFNPFMNL
ncbi:MAG: hypothetical protein K9N47_10340 [Prosthecobacter sp.]|uniref:hypothetical protein n=1 Tax=Prosthecobacter sp. TaxID=1965333 RepID=UPI0025F24966|nr:hypothetical protein [Prosthecobacter sp.]MCF7786511.1 hypothetical protein [Prosthecobacter sp.]